MEIEIHIPGYVISETPDEHSRKCFRAGMEAAAEIVDCKTRTGCAGGCERAVCADDIRSAAAKIV